MQLHISNDQFTFAHGKQPKGFGRWAFGVIDGSTRKQVGDPIFTPTSMSLTDAKKWVRSFVSETMAEEVATGFLSLSVLS